MNQSNKVKVAILGAGGYWAKNIITNLLSFPEISYEIAVNDIDDRYFDALCNKFGRSLSNDGRYMRFVPKTFKNILEDKEIKLVFIATPINTHYSIVSDCLSFNKHVFCEKPVAQKFEDSLYLYQIATQKKLILQVDHTFLFSPEINYFKDKIDKNLIYGFKSFLSRRVNWGPFLTNCSVIEDLCPHDVSIMGYLFGFENLSEVSCSLQNNEAFISFSYNNNFNYNNHVSWQQPRKERYLSFVGENIKYSYDSESSLILKYSDVVSVEKIDQTTTPLELSLRNFVNNYLSNKVNVNFDNVYNVFLLENIAQSGYSKKPINLANTYKTLKNKYLIT